MHVYVTCPRCLSDAIERRVSPDEMRATFEACTKCHITTRPWATGTCSQGHRIVIQINEPAYAVLYERALQRFIDYEFRDAVIDAYTAFDMYLSTVPVRARYDRDSSLVPSDLIRLREELKAAIGFSERALGAALAVISFISGKAPPKIEPKLQSIRNKAVHSGVYPSQEDTEWFLLEVENIIVAMNDVLDSVSKERDPSFRLARQMDAFVEIKPVPQGQSAIALNAVLGDTVSPRPTAAGRIEQYRTKGIQNRL